MFINDIKSLADALSIILRYERMSHGIGRLRGFLALPIDKAPRDEVVTASRFDAMRKLEQKVGGYADHLDSNDPAYIVDQCNQRLTPQARSLLLNAGIGV